MVAGAADQSSERGSRHYRARQSESWWRIGRAFCDSGIAAIITTARGCRLLEGTLSGIIRHQDRLDLIAAHCTASQGRPPVSQYCVRSKSVDRFGWLDTDPASATRGQISRIAGSTRTGEIRGGGNVIEVQLTGGRYSCWRRH